MTARRFTVNLSLDIDPDVWEGAGYDPLESDPQQAARQLAEYFTSALYAGPDQLPCSVGSIAEQDNPSVYPTAERSGLVHNGIRPVNPGEFHLLTLVVKGDSFRVNDAEGTALATEARPDMSMVVGPNYSAILTTLANALDLVEKRTSPAHKLWGSGTANY